jgi:hypothetical protein
MKHTPVQGKVHDLPPSPDLRDTTEQAYWCRFAPGSSYFPVRKAAYRTRLAGRVRLGDRHRGEFSFTSRVTSFYAPAEPSTHRSFAMTPKPTQRCMPLGPR